ncbi:MAG TPA: hypothetical protein VGS22_10275 [Thermoanaerobaculia bacterium]|jgi:hypothetical protein|nr:hypothetical protein [Thermoanaerobaculia bacterium]
MNPSVKKTPGAVLVVGMAWLVVAGLMVAWAAALLFVFGVVDNFTPGGLDGLPKPPPDAAEALPFYWTFTHYFIGGLLIGTVGLAGIYCGIHFLRFKPWARTALEVGGWAVIALCVAWGLWLCQFWTAARLESGDDSSGPSALVGIRLFTGLMTAAYFAVFPTAFVWLLRSRLVRPYFAAEGETSPKPS